LRNKILFKIKNVKFKMKNRRIMNYIKIKNSKIIFNNQINRNNKPISQYLWIFPKIYKLKTKILLNLTKTKKLRLINLKKLQ